MSRQRRAAGGRLGSAAVSGVWGRATLWGPFPASPLLLPTQGLRLSCLSPSPAPLTSFSRTPSTTRLGRPLPTSLAPSHLPLSLQHLEPAPRPLLGPGRQVGTRIPSCSGRALGLPHTRWLMLASVLHPAVPHSLGLVGPRPRQPCRQHLRGTCRLCPNGLQACFSQTEGESLPSQLFPGSVFPKARRMKCQAGWGSGQGRGAGGGIECRAGHGVQRVSVWDGVRGRVGVSGRVGGRGVVRGCGMGCGAGWGWGGTTPHLEEV